MTYADGKDIPPLEGATLDCHQEDPAFHWNLAVLKLLEILIYHTTIHLPMDLRVDYKVELAFALAEDKDRLQGR